MQAVGQEAKMAEDPAAMELAALEATKELRKIPQWARELKHPALCLSTIRKIVAGAATKHGVDRIELYKKLNGDKR